MLSTNKTHEKANFDDWYIIIIVQSSLTSINKLFSSTIVSSCSNNIVTAIILFFVNIEQLLIEQYSSTLSIQQVLLNLDNNVVQALFNEQCCINLINFCACMYTSKRLKTISNKIKNYNAVPEGV